MKFKNPKEEDLYYSTFESSKAKTVKARMAEAEAAVISQRSATKKRGDSIRTLMKKRHGKMKDT